MKLMSLPEGFTIRRASTDDADTLVEHRRAPDGSIAAGAGLWLMDWPPHMVGAGVRRGNILNVYTVVEFRRRGLARQLMETAVQWCRENRIDTIVLHASPDGRGLYESMGFRATNEMRINLETSS